MSKPGLLKNKPIEAPIRTSIEINPAINSEAWSSLNFVNLCFIIFLLFIIANKKSTFVDFLTLDLA